MIEACHNPGVLEPRIASVRLWGLFVLLSGIPLLVLGFLAWRLVEQDRTLEAQRLREIASAYYDKESLPPAIEALQPLLERDPPDPRDLIAAACIELKQGDPARLNKQL